MAEQALPRFTEHSGHAKISLLTDPRGGEPEHFVKTFLESAAARKGVPSSQLRVLDVGCGRGDRVAWLLDQGWNAWGADVQDAYLECGRGYIRDAGYGDDRLRLITGPGLPFEPDSFDVVLSDQVLEHVEDLDAFASGISSVTRRGGVGLHVFPARHRPIEPHMKTPFVHWLPKGTARRRALRLALRTGMSADYFTDYPLDDRTSIFAKYSEEETYYRSQRELKSVLLKHRIVADFRSAAAEKLKDRLPQIPTPALPLAAAAYGHLASVYLRTVQT